ncbi:MAG: hypothetical protein N3A66_09700, partial [Planctomycetota bacterium]|nr:hypothetical protein [Planctomycetota bacterium]
MNVFRQLLEEAQGVWRDMTSTQRVAVTTMVITIAALLAFVIYLGGTARELGTVPLPLKVEAENAKALIEKIEAAGLGPAQYDLESKRLLVPLEKSRDAVILLAQENLLPKDQGTDFEKMLDRWAFSDTRDKTEEMKRVARCNEVARLIERLEVVQEAKVIYSLSLIHI